MEKLFFGAGVFAVLIILEFVMMGAYQTLPSTKAKRILNVLCRVVLGLFIEIICKSLPQKALVAPSLQE